MDKVFTLVAYVRGAYNASYVFEGEADYQQWLKAGFMTIKTKYPNVTVKRDRLPGLKIGDTCHVCGEGSDVFVIEALIRCEDHRYSFVLKEGDVEEVAKCF